MNNVEFKVDQITPKIKTQVIFLLILGLASDKYN